MIDSASPSSHSSEFRLQGDRVYAVSVKAFANTLGLRHKVREGRVGHDDVCGSDGFVLVQGPCVQLVYRSYAGNLSSFF